MLKNQRCFWLGYQVKWRCTGVSLGEVQSIDYSWGEIDIRTSPVDKFEVRKSYALEPSYDIDIEPDDIDLADTVTMAWEIK